MLSLPTPEQARQQKSIQDQLAPLKKVLETQTPELDSALAHWIDRVESTRAPLDAGWQVLEPLEAKATEGVQLEKQPDHSVFSGGALPDNTDYDIILGLPADSSDPLTALRIETLTD